MVYVERISDVPAAVDCTVCTVATTVQASANAQGTSAEEDREWPIRVCFCSIMYLTQPTCNSESQRILS